MYAKGTHDIIDRREMLRVKLHSLVAESKIIRREESRAAGPLKLELALHRRGSVRRAARETGLALGFIRGRDYEQMEQRVINPPDWAAVRKMLKTYGPKDFREPDCMRVAEMTVK